MQEPQKTSLAPLAVPIVDFLVTPGLLYLWVSSTPDPSTLSLGPWFMALAGVIPGLIGAAGATKTLGFIAMLASGGLFAVVYWSQRSVDLTYQPFGSNVSFVLYLTSVLVVLVVGYVVGAVIGVVAPGLAGATRR